MGFAEGLRKMIDSQNSTPNYEEALRRVASLSSLSPTPNDIESLHAGIVLQALDALKEASSPERIASHIHNQLGIQMTVPSVVQSIGLLRAKGQVRSEDDLRVSIPAEVGRKLKEDFQSLATLRASIVDSWLEEVDAELASEGDEMLTALERLQLDEDLQIYLLQLVRYHGAEVALFLYPVLDDVRDILAIDEKILFRELPAREDRVLEIRARSLPAFVREAKGERAEYLAALLHRAALLQILQTDAEASVLFAEVLEGKTLYLDTNVVFRVLGLQGAVLRESSREILSLGARLGHHFAISKKTFDELKNLVHKQADWILQSEDIPAELGEVAAEFIAGNDYVSAYWRDRRTKGVSAERFHQTFEDLPLLLENFSISISTELSSEIHSDPEFRQAISLLKVFKSNDPALLIEHDAFHKLLVERLRERELGRPPSGWYEANFLFLTFDNALPIFAARAIELHKGHQVPFCLLGHEWLEVLHLADPSTTIPAEAFVALLNSPYLESYFFRRSLDRDLVREIGLTMGEMEEYRPTVARKLYANRAITNRIASMSDRGERQKFIREAVKREAEAEDLRIRRLLDEKEAKLEELGEKIKDRDEKIGNLTRSLRDELQVRKRKQERASRQRKTLEAERAELQGKVKGLQMEIESLGNLKSSHDLLKKRIESLESTAQKMAGRAVIADRVLLILPGVLGVYSIGAISRTEGQEHLLWWIALVVAVSPFVVGLGRRFRGRFWEILNRIASLMTIAIIVWDWFDLNDSLGGLLDQVGNFLGK